MSPREEKAYLPRAAGPREVSFFFPRAYFKVFYNPRDEEISIPDINGHSENLFLFEFIYVQNLFFFREIVMRTRHPGGNGNFSPGKNLARGEITISPRVTSAHDDFTEKKMKRYRNLSMAIAYIDSYRNNVLP